MSDTRKPNRLIDETSPYLLQHAHNPVEWWGWGDEAFAEARRRGVPVFLSIGYSTCYWCHVMERECFEDEAIAAQMSRDFVCIKVDREERPDVDDVYMAATVMMTGRGGWPMSVFLEPTQRRPFWCGTYFPPTPRQGMPSFPQVLEALSKAYREQKDAIEEQSEELAKAVREHLAGAAEPAPLGQQQVADAVSGLLKIFDRAQGGFGGAPKFPQPVFLEFLLDARMRAADDATGDAIDQAVRRTLDKMACGGIRDHVGGGFHRYSVDGVWLVPHFEKMLYDNAQLARVYARAARWYGDAWYEEVARETLAYVQREMTGEGGGFFSAQDAEVDGREGLNYLWTGADIREALGAENPEDAEFAIRVYGLDQGPNFQDPHHPGEAAGNVLRLEDRPERIAGRFNLSTEGFGERLKAVNARMYAARMKRKQPRLDDKVLTAWNGLMIGAFALAARELEAPELLGAAERAADFVLGKMVERGDGKPRLLRSYRAGVAKTAAFLEDHACLMHGLLELQRSAPGQAGKKRLEQAMTILRLAQEAFFDEGGAIFDTRAGSTELFVRTRSTHDGAVPAGVSVMLHSLLDLAELSGDKAYTKRAVQGLAAISSSVVETPVGTINSTRALLRMLVNADEVAGALAEGQARPAGLKSAAEILPVEIYASVDRVVVSEEKPAEITLFVKIAPGYHVPAAAPGEGEAARALIPFRVGIVNGGGVAAYAGYPEGEAYGDGVRVYSGEFELTVVLERQGEWSGQPLVSVRYQACTETECLAPVTVELDIAVDR